jgi:DNA polymerase-3 subunit gamma/tau
MADLATAYRPRDFDEVIGNKNTVEALKLILERPKDKVPKCILLSGPKGCGKTTLARIIAKHLGAYDDEQDYNPDFREYNIGDARGIDNARTITSEYLYAPQSGSAIVYMLDEIHRGTRDFMECLLKPMEEPPSHVFFILATTEPDKLPETIRSRCTPFTVETVSGDDIIDVLIPILSEEISWSNDPNFFPDTDFILKNFPSSIFNAIIKHCEGSPRNAIKLLDKVIDIEDENQAIASIESTFLGEASVKDVCDLLLSNKGKEDKWKAMIIVLNKIKDTRGQSDPEKIRRGVITWLTKVILNSPDHARIAIMSKCFFNNYYDTGYAGLIVSCYTACQV